MTSDALSQEEIDALLKGASAGGAIEPDSARSLTVNPRQAQALNVYAGLAAHTLSEMVGTFLATTAKFVPQRPGPVSCHDAATTINGKVVIAKLAYHGKLYGETAFIFPQGDACRIGGTMVGDPAVTEYADMAADAFQEVMNTVLGNLNSSLGHAIGTTIANTPLQIEAVLANSEALSASLGGQEQMVLQPYDMTVGDIIQGRCWQLISSNLLESIESLAAPVPTPAAPKPAAARETQPTLKAAPVQFDALSDEGPASMTAPANLDLLMDIELEVRVELGRSDLKIRDVLKLGNGSVVELDKLAGEPVDLLVNDVIFAKGEVVVIDENFGVRITDILSLTDRVKTFGERKG